MARYRSPEGQAAIRSWCEAQLGDRGRSTIGTSLGETHLVSAGVDGPTVVLVPGTNLNAATSLDVVDALTAHRRVVALDLPGQPGLSMAEPPGKDRIPAYGRWLDDVLADLPDGPFVLVGHSLGAAVVLASTPSVRVAGIILVDPAGLVKATIRPGVLATSTAWFVRPTDARSARLIERMLAPGHSAKPDLSEWFTLVGRHTRSDGAPGPVGPEISHRWRDTPRSVLVGEADTFFPPARLRPVSVDHLGVDVTVIRAAGHLLPHERPQAVVDAVLALPEGEPAPD